LPRFARPCLKCGGVSKTGGSYCPAHTLEVAQAREAKRSQDPRRKEKKKQLYNSDYRKAREQIVAYVREYGATCYLCNKPINASDYIDIDHLAPGNPFSQLAPTHRACNRSRGNKPTSY
jgi:hypothetical protein